MTSRRRIGKGGSAWGRAAILLLLFSLIFLTSSAEERPCRKCGAPLEAGAVFCTRCGARLEAGEAPAVATAPSSDARTSVVQLVANHDREITSTYGSIAHGSSVKIDSILGSAFAIAPGEFITDAGLVTGAKEVRLRAASGRSVPATVKGIDPMIGIALLSADLPEVPPLRPGTGGLPATGERLDALGFPSGAGTGGGIASSTGVMSGTRRAEMGMHSVEDYIQTDASLPRGFAGGPILDSGGRYVGMSTAWPIGRHMVMGPETGIGLSIPVPWIERGLAWIRSGQPPRAWIGALTVTADAENRQLYQVPEEVHRIVEYIFPGSPAQTAGLKRGDGVLSVEGLEASRLVEIQEKLLGASPGTPWNVDVLREGKKLTVAVTLAARPDRPRLGGADTLRFHGGIELEAKGTDRIVVSRVLPDSEALSAGVETGDILKDLFTKKDLDHPERDNARWRDVKNFTDLERLVGLAYSDFDFYVGLRFLAPQGQKRHLFLFGILTPSKAI